MVRIKEKDAKARIFEAALSLFARRGFAAVGVREIAKKANVNVSMINYYYGGKAGILKAIVNECYHKYYNAIKDVGDESTPLEEHVKMMVRTVINFFRENTEVAIVAFDVIPLDIPEVLDLKAKLITGISEGMKWFHKKLDIDDEDLIQASLGPGVFLSIILTHFQSRYAAENFPQFREAVEQFNDGFYERYSESLADLYLYGLKSITGNSNTADHKK